MCAIFSFNFIVYFSKKKKKKNLEKISPKKEEKLLFETEIPYLTRI